MGTTKISLCEIENNGGCDWIVYYDRELNCFQVFEEGPQHVQDNLNSKNFYAFNPAFDNGKSCNVRKKAK